MTQSETDRILVSDLCVQCHIGATPEERSVAQSLSVNIEMYLDLTRAVSSDRLEDSVDYGEVTMHAAEQLRSNRRHLLEAAAGDLLGRLLELPRVHRAGRTRTALGGHGARSRQTDRLDRDRHPVGRTQCACSTHPSSRRRGTGVSDPRRSG